MIKLRKKIRAFGPPENLPPVPPVPPSPPAVKTYTQEEVNTMMAENKRNLQKTNQQLITELETLKSNVNLSEEEKANLQTQIDQLTATFTTKEQQQKSEHEKVVKDLGTKLKTTEEQRDKAQKRYEDYRIRTDVYKHSSDLDAFNPEQILAILLPLTKMVEVLGPDNKPTGELAPQVDFTGKGSDGKPIQLKLTVHDAIKAMKEMPEAYGNLFKGTGTGGLGATGGNGSTDSAIPDIDNMTQQEYEKHREKVLAKVRASAR